MNVWFYDSEQYLIFCFSWCGYLYLSPCLQRVEIVYITIFWKVSVKKKEPFKLCSGVYWKLRRLLYVLPRIDILENYLKLLAFKLDLFSFHFHMSDQWLLVYPKFV